MMSQLDGYNFEERFLAERAEDCVRGIVPSWLANDERALSYLLRLRRSSVTCAAPNLSVRTRCGAADAVQKICSGLTPVARRFSPL